jgi:hypothetical protein
MSGKRGPHHGMVRRAGSGARRQVHIDIAAGFREFGCGQNVIDAPTLVSGERIGEEIPECVLNARRIFLPEDVHEPPIDRLAVGGSRLDVITRVVSVGTGVGEIDGLGRDVDVP